MSQDRKPDFSNVQGGAKSSARMEDKPDFSNVQGGFRTTGDDTTPGSVERIFIDVLQRCRPQQLSVHARYTRRGGLDINPWRATPGTSAPIAARDLRQ